MCVCEKAERFLSLDEKHEGHSRFPWWILPFTEINWIDEKDPGGAENCPGLDESHLRAPIATSWSLAYGLLGYTLYKDVLTVLV